MPIEFPNGLVPEYAVVKDQTHSPLETAAPLVAAGTPFIGAIGKSLKTLPGEGLNFKTFGDMAGQLQPGDILLTGPAKKLTLNKFLISLGTGTPEGQHMEVVNRILPNGSVETLELVPKEGWSKKILSPEAFDQRAKHKRVVTAMRAKDPQVALESLDYMRKSVDAYSSLEAKLIERGVSPAKAKKIRGDAYKQNTKGVGLAFTELFKPGLGASSDVVAGEVKNIRGAIDYFHDNVDAVADEMSAKIKTNKPIKDIIPKCLNGVCSTGIAGVGFPTQGTTSPGWATPGDLLRSRDMSQVGSYMKPGNIAKNKYALTPLLTAGPTLVRAGTGLGLAALTAGGINLARKSKKKKYTRKFKDEGGKVQYEYTRKIVKEDPLPHEEGSNQPVKTAMLKLANKRKLKREPDDSKGADALRAAGAGAIAGTGGTINTYVHTKEIVDEVNSKAPELKKNIGDAAGKAYDKLQKDPKKKEGLIKKLIKRMGRKKLKKAGINTRQKAQSAAASVVPEKLLEVPDKRILRGSAKSALAFGLPTAAITYAGLRTIRDNAKKDK